MNNCLAIFVNIVFCVAINQAYANGQNSNLRGEIKKLAIQSIEQSMSKPEMTVTITTQLPKAVGPDTIEE